MIIMQNLIRRQYELHLAENIVFTFGVNEKFGETYRKSGPLWRFYHLSRRGGKK